MFTIFLASTHLNQFIQTFLQCVAKSSVSVELIGHFWGCGELKKVLNLNYLWKLSRTVLKILVVVVKFKGVNNYMKI